MNYLVSLLDGPIEVALLCGNSEPQDQAYKRCTVNFDDGTNTEECKFGPYAHNFRSAITGYALYKDGELLGMRPVNPAQIPAEAEISTFDVGSLKIEIN